MLSMRPTGVQCVYPQLLKVQETRHILSNVSDLFFYQSLFLYKVRVGADVAGKRSQLRRSEFGCCFVSVFFFKYVSWTSLQMKTLCVLSCRCVLLFTCTELFILSSFLVFFSLLLLLPRDCFTVVCGFKLLPWMMIWWLCTNWPTWGLNAENKTPAECQTCSFFFSFPWNDGQPWGGPTLRPRCCSSAQTLTEESTWGQSRRAPLLAANKGQLNVTDFPTRDVTASVSGRHRNHCQESWAKDVPSFFLFFSCCHHSWHMCRLYYQQSPGLQGTHGNWLSGLAPSLHLANAYGPQPPDVTFPDDWAERLSLVPPAKLVSHFFFIPLATIPAFSNSPLRHPMHLSNARLPVSLSFTSYRAIPRLPRLRIAQEMSDGEQNWASVIPR